MQFVAIIALLDFIHDKLLHPIFKDGQDVDYSQIIERLDKIQHQIEELKNGNNNNN